MRAKSSSDFKTQKQVNQNSFEVGYDLIFDKDLIQQSIAKQYHILPSQQEELKYSDWVELLAGIMDDTPLGRTVQIRLEHDKDIIKNFSAAQRKIRSDWQEFLLKQPKPKINEVDYAEEMRKLEQMIAKMFGGDEA